MKKAVWLLVILVLGSLISSLSPADATMLTAGASAAPDAFSLGYSSSPPLGQSPRTVLSTSPNNPFLTTTSPTFTGQFYEQVESDPANVFCAGCVDFIFQFDNTSTQSITRITQNGFSGFQVDVGYDVLSLGSTVLCGIDDNGFCNSGNPSTVPTSVDLSANGDVVGFSFPGFGPGESTVDLVIETNATSFTDPTMTVYGSNGDALTLDAAGPAGTPVVTSSVPEPSAVWLLAAGLLGVLGLRVKADAQRRSSIAFRRSA